MKEIILLLENCGVNGGMASDMLEYVAVIVCICVASKIHRFRLDIEFRGGGKDE